MSKKQWMALLMLFLAYLLLGASIFYYIEHAIEIEQVEKAHHERIEINALLYKHCTMRMDRIEILEKITDYCGKSVYNYTNDETDQLKWDFYNSFYFAYTVVSTIGYGNLVPTTMPSKILMIFYALLGIPMNGILLSQLGDFFSVIFIRAHDKYKSYKENQHYEYTKKLTPLETRKAGLAARVLMYLAPGCVMFIFFPALVISYYEETTYNEAVYYAFVTLTTIGFGDIVAGLYILSVISVLRLTIDEFALKLVTIKKKNRNNCDDISDNNENILYSTYIVFSVIILNLLPYMKADTSL